MIKTKELPVPEQIFVIISSISIVHLNLGPGVGSVFLSAVIFTDNRH
jgi:hypothetical protein